MGISGIEPLMMLASNGETLNEGAMGALGGSSLWLIWFKVTQLTPAERWGYETDVLKLRTCGTPWGSFYCE